MEARLPERIDLSDAAKQTLEATTSVGISPGQTRASAAIATSPIPSLIAMRNRRVSEADLSFI